MTNYELFPRVEPLDLISFSEEKKRLLITSEGFEERSLSFMSQRIPKNFDKIIICKYYPPKESQYEKLLNIIQNHYSKKTKFELVEVVYNRFEPFLFEIEMQNCLMNVSQTFEEIVLDISVMSKYMIMQIICLLKEYIGDLRIVYTEPMYCAPTQEDGFASEQNSATLLPSVGVENIVRTPLLSSLVMQQSPSLLVAFLSFNEQLIRALLSECNPSRVLLINGVHPHLLWREKATCNIHKTIIKENYHDNPVDENGQLIRKCSTLYYSETFELLANIYKSFGEDYRIILSPTGSKMQAVGCSLVKSSCEDIHIEYPTPESYYVAGYSSSEIRLIHQISFRNFKNSIQKLATQYALNG